jgi:hypothetical protein
MSSKTLKLGTLHEYSLMLLSMDDYSHNFIRMEEIKGIVELLVNWDLIRLVDFDSFSSSLLSMA